jgi:hypothetical protein
MTAVPDIPCYGLSLADGTRWRICAGDPVTSRVMVARTWLIVAQNYVDGRRLVRLDALCAVVERVEGGTTWCKVSTNDRAPGFVYTCAR